VSTFVLATESGIPGDSLLGLSAVPLGIAIFLGLPYLLLRSNLGTKRGYLVLASTLFSFLFLIGLFWAFGAPGTPALTGPTNLPGTPANEYQPLWVPFAEDSLVAEDPTYAFVADEGAFEAVPEEEATEAETGAGDILSFFTSEPGGNLLPEAGGYVIDPEVPIGYAEAENGRPVIRVTFAPTYRLTEAGAPPEGVTEDQIGQVIPEDEAEAPRITAFAFFDGGSPLFPILVFIGVAFALFVIHAWLLYMNEVGEAREREADAAAEAEHEEPVAAGV
jgi:hypothetical protein